MRPPHVQAICANYLHKLLDDCCRRYKMLPKPSVCKRHIAWSIVLQITTAGTTTRCQLRVITEVCLCKQAKHSDGASIGCLRKKNMKLVFDFTQTVISSKQQVHLTLIYCIFIACLVLLFSLGTMKVNQKEIT